MERDTMTARNLSLRGTATHTDECVSPICMTWAKGPRYAWILFDERSLATLAVVLGKMIWSMQAPGQSWTQKISCPDFGMAELCII